MRRRARTILVASLVFGGVASCAFDGSGLPPVSDEVGEGEPDPIGPVDDGEGELPDAAPPPSPPDAALPEPPPDAAQGGAGYGERCDEDDDCASGVCVDFKGPKGKRCTIPCEVDLDCPMGDRCEEREGERVCEP